jgi:serine/threonine-protein kinase
LEVVSAFEPRRFGAYTLQARLGRGGMAEVFRAQREGAAGFARTVVVKRILGTHNEDPSFVDMFINEAKIASQLTHPNIVQVHELGQVDGEFFIVMEYVKGKDLLRILRELAHAKPQNSAIPPEVAAYIARETCRGLSHAHDHKDEEGNPKPIIHRDVSPQNIMISYDGQVKLVDFGIAKAMNTMREETRTGALKGKFAYMAPEQVGGQSPGPQSDVFSTGVVFHEMLTGRRLFKGASDFETLSKVKTMPISPPSSLSPQVPPELDAVAALALERDRTVRYQRANLMARDLDEYLQSKRFSVEAMAEFMVATFPIESREETPEGHLTTTYMVKSSEIMQSGEIVKLGDGPRAARGDTHAGTPRALGTPSHSVSPSGTGGRRSLAVAAGLAATVAIAGIVFVPMSRRPTRLASSDVATTQPAVPEKPAMVGVEVSSEPPAAQIFEGPRLLGTAPATVRMPARGTGVSLTLVHEGRLDLSYIVRPSDAPSIKLRLEPLPAPPVPVYVAPAPVRPEPSSPPKVRRATAVKRAVWRPLRIGKPGRGDIPDDASPSSRPRVEPIDE